MKKEWTLEEDLKLKSLVDGTKSFAQIGMLMKRSGSSCLNRCYRIGATNTYRKRYESFDEQFWSIPNLQNSYWAGYSSADSQITKKPSYRLLLSAKDTKQLERLKQDCRYTGKLHPYFNGVSDCCLFVVHACKQWIIDLDKNFGVVLGKSRRVEPKLNSHQLKYAFLIGFIDGDGSLSLAEKQTEASSDCLTISISSCSKPVIEWANNLIQETVPVIFNQKSKIGNSVGRVGVGTYTCQVGGIRALLLYSFLKDFDVPKLARKWQQAPILALLEEKKQKYPELFARFKAHTDELLKNNGGLSTSSEPNVNNYQIT